MKRLLRRPSLWIVVFVALAGGAFAVLKARGPQVSVTQPRRQAIEQHVVASGRVWVPTRISVSPQVAGLVVAVGVVEGQRVRAGDLLLQLDDAEARATVAQAQAAVNQASARVSQLRKVGAIVATQALLQAETSLSQASADFARASKLAQSGAVAQSQLDESARRVEIARAQKSAAEAQQLSAAPDGADSRLALSALLQTQAQLTAAQARLSHARMVALQPGLVLTREVEPGDVVQPGRTLLTIAADSETQLVITPDERNVATIRLGQKARASADAYPSQIFEAEVSYIAPAIDPQRGSVEVRLRVAAPPPELKPDMTISVDLTVATKPSALTLPSDAITGAATASPTVMVLQDERATVRPVVLGIRGDGQTEILSGIDETTRVIVSDTRALKSGQRVRAQLTEQAAQAAQAKNGGG